MYNRVFKGVLLLGMVLGAGNLLAQDDKKDEKKPDAPKMEKKEVASKDTGHVTLTNDTLPVFVMNSATWFQVINTVLLTLIACLLFWIRSELEGIRMGGGASPNQPAGS
jgi:hypothetical protein